MGGKKKGKKKGRDKLEYIVDAGWKRYYGLSLDSTRMESREFMRRAVPGMRRSGGICVFSGRVYLFLDPGFFLGRLHFFTEPGGRKVRRVALSVPPGSENSEISVSGSPGITAAFLTRDCIP